ncbi:MAG TPA: prolipoprotein diacylglyceryl transferase [Tepidisphaeraceae bacterium]|jgi:phosphatidylglycerol:prolipoprotein diacylglycerol transferase
MWQEVFRIPFIDRPVYGYGLMLVIGFIAAAQLAKVLARRCSLNGEVFVNAALLALVAGVVGARLSHVLESLADPHNTEFARNGRSLGQNLWAMLNVSSGGLTYYGGFLLATPVLIGYAIWKKVPLLRGMDIVAPCLMVGLAFGRIGCFFNGCCYGAECSLPWGTAFPYGSNAFVEQYENGEITVPADLTDAAHPYANGLPRLLTKEEIRKDAKLVTLADSLRAKPVQPAELYSAFTAFFIAGMLVVFFSLAPAPGRVFALMLMVEGTSRFILEMLRVEPVVWVWLRWSFSMVLSAIFVALGIVMWLAVGMGGGNRGGARLAAV